MQTCSISYTNNPVYYSVSGGGLPVVLIHGFAEDGTVWQDQVDFLKKDCKLIVPDIPGSGQSPFIDNANIETYAAIIKEIIDAENKKSLTGIAEKIFVIGHSMGGYIALAFAAKYPELLQGLGLFHSTAYPDAAEKKSARQKSIGFIKENGVMAFLKTSTPNLFTQSFNQTKPNRVAGLIKSGQNFTAAALIQYYEAMIKRPDRTAVLKSLQCPVLFIIGENDTAVPLQISLQQCHLPVCSFVHILHQSAHMGMWEETEAANNILAGFLFSKF